MARNQSLNHRNSDFRPQTSDLIFALQLQYYSFQKAKARASFDFLAKRSCVVLSHDFLAGCNPTEIAGVELDDAIAMTDKNLGGTLASLATATVDGDGLAEGKGCGGALLKVGVENVDVDGAVYMTCGKLF